MTKYLYGVSIQGIQEFIYKTNELQEIIGASEIIDGLGRDKESESEIYAIFHKLLSSGKVEKMLLNAAGNFKAIVPNKEMLESIAIDLPKKIMQNACGIIVSQAAVKLDGISYDDALDELETRLKVQRNRPSLPLDMSINIMALSPKTARALYKNNGKDMLDLASTQKRQSFKRWFDENRDDLNLVELKEFKDISNSKNKLAIIHADGNGLGVIVKNLWENAKDDNGLENVTKFSKALDKATKDAFDDARDGILKIYPKGGVRIKQLILSGDDMTAVCSADIALEFTKIFMQSFERHTRDIEAIKAKGYENLTICAGIAYCNEKYPFHYAVNLAEKLCGEAKSSAKSLHNKDIAPSCLMFHNIQSSNFDNWAKFIKDELTIKNSTNVVQCDFGPYYLDKLTDEASIDDLLKFIKILKREDSPKAKYREWLKQLGISDTQAKFMIERINEMMSESMKKDINTKLGAMHKELNTKDLFTQKLTAKKESVKKTPIYDALQILSISGDMR
ncbi:hypothetical protein CCAL13119_07130 [Campylobacter sp. RM13119]|uniref:Cas10/Cmr2 second palm domain-containing protein n=1 Tax=Campylobacter californiensis TaxID=1032243 RepID=UPI00147577C3|nr:hypothetical protein [Campylobacter sp. RM13119]MBE3606715.1 hypothetical protein [Campylobacter sp. RM13119]